ncbi:MAG: adenosylcobinamide-GDP ribazoletransferase [Bacteroidaceae bacterium]|nr:adenosylcobinamide-GDP ribazoletransferase [Bacteroidaceae bacterium]
MQELRNISKRIVAAIAFFTRLPAWRIVEPEPRDYKRVVPLWPLAGWITGGMMACTFWIATTLGFPPSVGVVLTLLIRILLTGGLHEDGLADFCDGMGGGGNRERTLQIMKDSRTGTFGVLGLVGYCLLWWTAVETLMARGFSPLVFPVADTMAKYIASTIIYTLPYARPESESKNRFAYSCVSASERLMSLLLGLLPLAICLCIGLPGMPYWGSWASGFGAGLILLLFLIHTMRRRIGGYTGDCCGATMLMAEVVIYLSLIVT